MKRCRCSFHRSRSLRSPSGTVGVAAYLCVNRLLRALRLDWSQSPWVKGVVLGHNLLLCVYSGWTLVTALSLLAWSDLVDVNGEAVFAAPGFAGLAHLFYWSKYYEFFDTWIHYLKGRSPGFLQVFHHVGAVGVMAVVVKYQGRLVLGGLQQRHTDVSSFVGGASG